jgi:prepilin-type processing-associated H-X9-DG protein
LNAYIPSGFTRHFVLKVVPLFLDEGHLCFESEAVMRTHCRPRGSARRGFTLVELLVVIHNDDGIFRFHTVTTPNSSSPDLISSTTFFTPNNDPKMPVALGNPQRAAARSRHPGGVMAAMCDGSVRFASNTIAQNTWMAMGSMAGGEAFSE